MLISVQGVYRNGRIELTNAPNDVPEGTWAIVTFVRANGIDLKSQGINREQAEILQSNLATFGEDWNTPEMSIYDDYDAAQAKHQAG
jgi:hypothetical protein